MAASRGEMMLAEAAHTLWCERRLAEGWRPAPACSASKLEHSALVPFERLAADEREHALFVMREENIPDRLVNLIDLRDALAAIAIAARDGTTPNDHATQTAAAADPDPAVAAAAANLASLLAAVDAATGENPPNGP